jgi:hypothetical protein
MMGFTGLFAWKKPTNKIRRLPHPRILVTKGDSEFEA